MSAVERAFDPEMLRLLQGVLDDVAASLPPEEMTHERKSLLASQILTLAASGETDPVRLRATILQKAVDGYSTGAAAQ
jgi:hypothetical protein